MITYKPPIASGYSKKSIQRFAEHTAEHTGFKTGMAMPDLVKQLGGKVIYQHLFHDLTSSENGSLVVHANKSFNVYTASHTSLARDQFTLAHELGHYILHVVLPKLNNASLQDQHFKVPRYGDGRLEYEANWFASAFLMAETRFQHAYQSCCGDIVDVADFFNVTISAAQLRKQELGM